MAAGDGLLHLVEIAGAYEPLVPDGGVASLPAGVGNFTITDGTSTATVSEVEEVNITLSGGETVTINGDFTGTGVNIGTFTIDGSAGTTGETVDARNLSSAHEVDFTGGTGNDTFYSGHGNDTFHGGLGNDTVNYTVGSGTDTIDGGGDSDTLNVFGTTGDDTIHVSVNGSGAITSIEGMSPASIEVFTADGLGGSDTLDYSGSGSNPITVNLATPSATGFTSIAGIENAIGTSGADTFTSATTGVNTFTGGDGDDTYNIKAGSCRCPRAASRPSRRPTSRCNRPARRALRSTPRCRSCGCTRPSTPSRCSPDWPWRRRC